MHLRLPPVSFVASARPHAPPPLSHHQQHSTAAAPGPVLPAYPHTAPERPKPSPPPAHQLETAREATELPPALAEAKRRVHERLERLKEEQGSRRRGSAACWGAGAGSRAVQLPKERARSEDSAVQGAEGAARPSAQAEDIPTKSDPTQASKVASTSTASNAIEPSLPETEPALLALLRRLSRQHPAPHPEWIAYFHSLPAFETIVSPRTYAHLLHLAHSRSDCPKLYNELLEEMKERKFWSEEGVWAAHGRPGGDGEWAARQMLAAALKRGSRHEVEQVLELMRGRGWGGITVINDARNLGSTGEGNGDERHKWKGKGKVEERRSASALPSRPSPSPSPQPPWTPPRTPKMVRYSATTLHEGSSTFHELDHLLRRQPPHMPRDPSRVTAEDAATLVESFVIEEKAPEAFRIAQIWLKAARQRLASAKPQAYSSPSTRLLDSLIRRRSSSTPLTRNPPPSLVPYPPAASPSSPADSLIADDKFARIAYHKTAIVLLNILLKSLFSERASLGVVKNFMKEFAERNGSPSPTTSTSSSPSSSTHSPLVSSSPNLTPLTPGLTTLRTLLSGLEGRDGGFAKGVSIVKWFSLQWGLPRTEWELLSFGEEEEGSPRLQFDVKKGVDDSGLPPHFLLDGSSALLLLRLAMADHRRWDTQLPPARREAFVELVRGWWTALEKEEGDAEDVWCTRDAKVLECKAVESGLLDPKMEDRTGLLGAVMASRARERRVEEKKRGAWLAGEKERQKRGVGRGEQKVAAWVVDS